MQKNSKIIIAVLTVLCLTLSVGWAYQAGYVTSVGIFDDEDELEAKTSSFWANYVNRFDFDGTEFVQNIALAVPVPEKLQYDKNYLLGTLTFKHNETKAKVIYVDTPVRVNIINDEGIFFYTKEILDNLTTRHKFHALPNVEYNIEYQINNINEFVDESGDVFFTLRNSEETKKYDVVTHFKSPLSDYETQLKIGFKAINGDNNFYYKDTITDEIRIKLKDRKKGEIALIDTLGRIYDYGDSIGIWYMRSRAINKELYARVYVSGETEIRINGNSVYIGDQVFYLASTSIGKTIWFGGVQNTETKTFGRYDFGAGIDLARYHYSYWDQICVPAGYLHANTYVRGGYEDNLWYIQSNKWQSYTSSRYAISTLTCDTPAFQNDADQVLYSNVMDEPYMLDASKEIAVNHIVSEIKVDLGEIIKTIEFEIDENNVTRFTLLDDIKLKEFEPFELNLIVDGKNAVIPIFYDPLRKHEELWQMFDREVLKLSEIVS